MHVKAHPGSNRGQCSHEILRKCQLGQNFVTFDEGNPAAGSSQNLRIVARVGLPMPFAMRREDIGKTEGLRGLHTSQFFSGRRASHLAIFSDGQAVDDRKDGYGTRMGFESVKQSLDDREWEVGPCRIVDKNPLGMPYPLKGRSNRLLACFASGDEFETVEACQRDIRMLLAIFWDGNDQWRRPGLQQRFRRMPQHRLAAPQSELLWQWLTGAQTLARGDDNRGEGG